MITQSPLLSGETQTNSRVSTAVIKQLKAAQGGEGYFLLQLLVHHPGKSGQEIKAGTWRQDLKQEPWTWLAQYAFIHNPGSWGGTTHSPTSIIIQQNDLTDLPTGQSDRDNSMRVLSSGTTLAFVKSTELVIKAGNKQDIVVKGSVLKVFAHIVPGSAASCQQGSGYRAGPGVRASEPPAST